LVGKLEGKRPLEKTRSKWENNIRNDLRETVVDWIHLAQYRKQWLSLVSTVMNMWISLGGGGIS
jgi:antibiotic biosynthesis monooxygenase (ABM) superfamily enzyme